LAPSHWAASTINAYVSRGIMSGYPDGTFRPEASVTRAEFVKMVNSVFGYNTPAAISFPDVSASYWGYDEIAKGVYAGYINGDESGKFNPDAPLTREEAASIICRIKGLAPNQSASSNYTDSSRIASWAAPYVGAATQFGYMQGNGDGTFNPTKALTRAEAATVLAKAESSKTYTTTPGSSGSSNNNNNNNNANNTVLGKPGVSNSTNTDKVKDYTMSTRDKTLANKTITGN
ncbi:MAG: S-layer homology domain-containing protein, partial [Firmicutes bacterium]|nr:S-layer homology domain-containing protein [Bacillota bacterium]